MSSVSPAIDDLERRVSLTVASEDFCKQPIRDRRLLIEFGKLMCDQDSQEMRDDFESLVLFWEGRTHSPNFNEIWRRADENLRYHCLGRRDFSAQALFARVVCVLASQDHSPDPKEFGDFVWNLGAVGVEPSRLQSALQSVFPNLAD